MAVEQLWRVKYNFKQQANKTLSWSMSFWNAAGDYATAKLNASDLYNVIGPMCGAQTLIEGWTILDKTVPRKGTPISGDQTAKAVGNVKDSDYPTTAALFYLVNAPGVFTKMELRGLPDSIIGSGGRLIETDAAWATAEPAFKTALTGGKNGSNWRIHVQDTSKPEKSISSIDLTVGEATVTGHGFGIGTTTKCRVKGVTTPKRLRGFQSMFATDANHLQFLGVTFPIADELVKLQKTASLREVSYANLPITSVEFIRSTKRNVRRPT